MNRTATCIRMLELLSSVKIMKIVDLANVLGVNPRNIPEYRKELESAGYEIESIPGRYGGYSLKQDILFPSLAFTELEVKAIEAGSRYLLARNDFMNRIEYEKAIAKLLANEKNKSLSDTKVIFRFPLAMSESEIQKRYNAIALCVAQKKRLEIQYQSLSGNFTFKVDPYQLFMYNNAWFFLAFDHYRCDVGFFKVNRILDFTILPESFLVYKYFNESDYLDELGMRSNNDTYKIKLELSGTSRILLEERVYGRNQVITEENGKMILSVEMRSWWEIRKFVLGFGSKVRVLEPAKLREEL